MGNILASDEKSWLVSVNGDGQQLTRIRAKFTKTEPQTVQITGPRRLECTIEVNNARIQIEDDGHYVTVIGNDNVIVITGSQTRIRIRGRQNNLSGEGGDTILYSDNEDDTVKVENIILTRESEFSPDVPRILELLEGDDNANDESGNNLDIIRITYRARDNGSGDAADTKALTGSNVSLQVGMKRSTTSEDDDNIDEIDRKRSRTED